MDLLRSLTQLIVCSNVTAFPSFKRSVLYHRLFFCLVVFGLLAVQMFKRTNFNFPFRPYFFFKKRLRFSIQEQALSTFAERRLLGKYAAQFLSENLSVV